MKASSKDAKVVNSILTERNDKNFIRKILYGSEKPLPQLKVCRWVSAEDSSGKIIELPPTPECAPDRLDVAVHNTEIKEEELKEYVQLLNGNVERLHICNDCTPDITVSGNKDKRTCDIYSIWGLMNVGLILTSSDISRHYLQATIKAEDLRSLLGTQFLHIKGLAGSIKISGIETDIIVLFNIAGIVVIALWLALKAHRRVLDYFSRSGALLPMVAATGQRSFYTAIWILTIVRVLAFLTASLPLTIYSLHEIMESNNRHFNLFINNYNGLFMWILTVVIGLAFATLIASIAELKHRHHVLSFTYKFIPILICSSGAFVWALSFLFEGSVASALRNVLVAMPIVGLAPVLIAPAMKIETLMLLIHSLLTLVLLVVALKANARWFAAHLEEI